MPFVHPERFNAPRFRAAVAKFLGFRNPPEDDDPTWLRRLKATIRDRPSRRALANLYNDHLRRDRNLSSMMLYSGPILPGHVDVRALHGAVPYPWHPLQRAPLQEVPIAWIGTGDAHLDRNNRRLAFEQFFGARLHKAGSIMLPHHGSKHNLNPQFFQDHPDRIWIAAYGTDNTPIITRASSS